MSDNLIAREKEEKYTFWCNAGIIFWCYNLVVNNDGTFSNLFLSTPILFSLLSILFDYLSNIVYYVKVEKNSNASDIPNRWLNIHKFVMLGISILFVIVIYITKFII